MPLENRLAKKVLIMQKSIPKYRVDFFTMLKDELANRDIELTVVGGQKNDKVNMPWIILRDNVDFKIGTIALLWQPTLDLIKKNDLIIVENANKLLINYILMIYRKISGTKLAFWGHGRNMQGKEKGIKNRLKYMYIEWCDYWFAYTEGVKDFLKSKNVSENMITVLNNAIDTKTLKKQYVACTDDAVMKMKNTLNIESEHIAIYSGTLYDIKKIDFLIESAIDIRKEINDFNLLIIGSGPDEYMVTEASKKYAWIHNIGAKFGEERVVYFKMSSLFMLPGAVGLAILDSFATETPMITTDIPLHGPEIDYLENNINGIMTVYNKAAYVNEVIDLLVDKDKINILKQGCSVSNEKYTVENMVNNFAEGIEKVLYRNV